jgi:hypothetical protein
MSTHLPTVVTAAFDLGRDQLDAAFYRDPYHYQKHLKPVLALACPLVIYTEPSYVEFIKSHRSLENTRIIVIKDHLFPASHYSKHIEQIRTRSDWLSQADWLQKSPQATLKNYNPLIFSKLIWLNEQVVANPFGTNYFYWLDGAINHTVPEALLQASSLARLTRVHQRFLFVCFPYHAKKEVHGFCAQELAIRSGVQQTCWVARGGLFGGPAEYVQKVATQYDSELRSTLEAGLMGTEESLFTLLSYRHPQWFDLQFVTNNGLIWPFFQELAFGWPGRVEHHQKLLPELAQTWFISFNAPKQFSRLLTSIQDADPALLQSTEKFLINNSTDAKTFAEYDRLCATHHIQQIREGNKGINLARQFAAEHFYNSGRAFMFWFEDDMLLVGPAERASRCSNGFTRHIPAVGATSLAILQKENIDYIKFSFTEFYGSCHTQWGWHNLSQKGRERYFPDALDPPRTRFHAIYSVENVPYALGEVFYSHWPTAINRRGTKTLFLDRRWDEPREQYWTAYSFQQLRAGALRSAVLLASPVNHNRSQEYEAAERKE